jgi:hypothetical protein
MSAAFYEKVPGERHVLADQQAQSGGNREPEGLVVTIADTNREAASFKAGGHVQYAEHLHPSRGDPGADHVWRPGMSDKEF